MKESKVFKSLVASFIIIVLSSPAVVLADTSSRLVTNKCTVSYADLNLENDESVRVLYRRLQQASREMCDVASPRLPGYLHLLSEARQCYRDSLSNAVDKIDNEVLTRIHAG
jgi:UrcA family protein